MAFTACKNRGQLQSIALENVYMQSAFIGFSLNAKEMDLLRSHDIVHNMTSAVFNMVIHHRHFGHSSRWNAEVILLVQILPWDHFNKISMTILILTSIIDFFGALLLYNSQCSRKLIHVLLQLHTSVLPSALAKVGSSVCECSKCLKCSCNLTRL